MRGSTVQGSSTGSVRGRLAAAKLDFTVLFFFLSQSDSVEWNIFSVCFLDLSGFFSM